MQSIEWLGESEAGTDVLGGKGASLDRLAGFGFAVPPGFCITTAAFRAQLSNVVGSVGGASDTDTLAAAMTVTSMGPEIADELGSALARLETMVREPGWAPRLAVRSSAIGEDGSLTSYAGLHETELNKAPDEVAGAVQRCWASLWSPEALAYRERRGIPLDGAAMAVVVQQLVPADASAVVFTRHPVTGREDQLVVTAAHGLGDAMVSGLVTPEMYVVAKSDGAVLEFGQGESAGRAIDDRALDELVALCIEVERRFGIAVDVEAARAGGRWYLLQARPITTAGPSDAAAAPEPAVGDATNPAGAAATAHGAAAADAPEVDDFPVDWPDPADAEATWELDDMHMPVALTPLAADYTDVITQGFNPALRAHGSSMELRSQVINGRYYLAEDLGVSDDEVPAMMERLWAGRRAAGATILAYWHDEALPELHALYERVRSVDASLPGGELAAAWEDAWAAMERAWVIHFHTVWPAYRVVEDFADLYERLVPGAPAGEAGRLLQGEIKVLQAVEAGVEALAELAARTPAVAARLRRQPPPLRVDIESLDGGPAFLTATDAYLAEHGHLGQLFDDLLQASWVEEPSLLFVEIGRRLGARAGGEASDRASSGTRRAQLLAEADRLRDAARAAVADRPEDARELDRQLALAREVGTLTEVHNYWIDRMSQSRTRELATRVGARLVADGVLGSVDDVFHLHRGEITELLRAPRDRRDLIAERRARHRRNESLRPPRYLGVPPKDYGIKSRFGGEAEAAEADDRIQGIGASPGTARGTARVVRGPSDFARVAAGEIVVCASSNPSWIPVFGVAGGLVTNTGGVLAHAAVVAREFGLPAVVGTRDATMRIADGRTIELDGTTGLVTLL